MKYVQQLKESMAKWMPNTEKPLFKWGMIILAGLIALGGAMIMMRIW